MLAYRDLLHRILTAGDRIPSGAVLRSTGQPVGTRFRFGDQLAWDLGDGFPAVTLKQLHWPAVVHELAWFVRGETNVRTLPCRIWDDWADAHGDCGPIYGAQWRHHVGVVPPTDREPMAVREVDQLATLVAGIRRAAADPADRVRRRLLVSAWAPSQIDAMGLPPCHDSFVAGVHAGRLSLCVRMRSCDAVLGLPFNIASYALLCCALARITGLEPGDVVWQLADVHIYDNLVPQAEAMVARDPLPPPRLALDGPMDSLDDLGALTPDRARLVGYRHHGPLPGEIAV